MRMTLAMAVLMAAAISVAMAAGTAKPMDGPTALVGVKSADSAVAQRSIAELRSQGPAGLAALLAVYDKHPDPALIPAIDAVAGQRGAVVSRLYWYTDLGQAQAAAREQRKPILYLRMMGKLTDEYSCANSRFFRTVLYSNRTVSAMLRDQFVLVWVSERPVPVVTIDYGDGRMLKRTLTGNSIHYVLDSNGTVIDALPGLFDPVAFCRILTEAAGNAGVSKPYWVRSRYVDRADDEILRQWKADASAINPQWIGADARTVEAADKADAAAAMTRTASKMMVEAPILRKISPQFATEMDQSMDKREWTDWSKFAALHLADAKLDDQSVAVIRSQNPSLYSDPAALDRTVGQFQETIAEDCVRDNDQMRRQILGWMRDSTTPISLDDLNRRVYSELFLTPKNDPWLGLLPAGTYTALMDDGCCIAAPQ